MVDDDADANQRGNPRWRMETKFEFKIFFLFANFFIISFVLPSCFL